MPKTLDETYERILKAIAASHKGDVIRALAIIIGSRGNLGRISIHTVVSGVKTHHERDSFFDVNTLRKQCVSLINVDADDTVALAHYTVHEFLASSRTKKSLPDFHLPEEKANQIFCNAVMLGASRYRHRNDADLCNLREYPNGDPVDFTLYGLRNTRVDMYWNRRVFLAPKNEELARDLLNPYGPAFRGLQLLGRDDHTDTANEQQFEWLVKFNKKAGDMEKAAAHLTMLLSFHDQKELADSFLKKRKDKNALFKAEMDITFPVDWKIHRQRGAAGGGFDSKPTSVTVIDFYEEGRKRGFDTQAKIKMIRDNFGSFLPDKAFAQKAPAPTNSNTKSIPGHGTPKPADRVPASGQSSGGRGTPSGGNMQSGHAKPNPTSNTSDEKKPQAQSHGQPHAQTRNQGQGNQGQGNQGQGNQGQGNQGQGNLGQGKPQAQTQNQGQGNQGHGNQGQGKPQAQSQNQGQGKPQTQSQNQGQGKHQAQSQNQGQGKPQPQSQNQGQGKSQNTVTPTTNNGAPNRNQQTTQGVGSSSKDTTRG
jgi:hypothetical protein